MYIARFSYSVLPVNRQRAVDFIQREVKAAQSNQLTARLLVPLTRGPAGAAPQFEVELASLDQFDRFRERGMQSEQDTAAGCAPSANSFFLRPKFSYYEGKRSRLPNIGAVWFCPGDRQGTASPIAE
jgi:hypothetical protein